MLNFIKQLFDGNERDIQKYRKVAEKINALEPETKALSDDALRGKTAEFQARVAEVIDAECETRSLAWESLPREQKRKVTDAALDNLLPEAFAVCREAAVRTIGQRHFDVQLIGGMVLHDGRVAEMKTGEGKTLTATLALYLNALTGHGVHLVTANDYLSKVGAVGMGPIYHFLGLTVGIIQNRDGSPTGGSYVYDPEYRHPDPRYDFARPADSRRECYDSDIVYGTNNEYGFDYLFDNLALPGQELNQTEITFAIVDEVDSILIDEARTPLIISGQAEASSDLYVKMDRIIRQLQETRDYKVEEKQKTAVFSEDGQKRVELALGVQNLTDSENVALMQHANAALKAHAVYKRDIDYLVKKNEQGREEVVIIDEFTGRLMFGRRWGDGLHQAVEAKEGVKIENENRTTATITFQNLFRLYPKLGGMTGTAKTEEDELRKIYALDVVVVPTNKPMVRKDQPDMIFKSEEAKLRGIAREILTLYARQQPVLVGTRSVEMSERVSDRLRYDRLEVLGMADILRDRMDGDKKLDKAKYNEWNGLLNQKITTLTANKFTEIARNYGMTPNFKDSANTDALLKLLGIAPENRSYLEEAVSHGIPHNILNAKSHEKEAKIIAEAGRKGTVTIATNMAGRGVDILLGGSIAGDEGQEESADDYEYRRGGARVVGLTPVGARGSAEHQAEADAVRALGGLCIIGSERHESRRIDNQLRGRAGRQGDPGASRFYVSFEDELMRLFGDKTNSPLLQSWAEDQSIDAPLLSKMIERAQKKVEMHYFDIRKSTLDYDDVMNVQREKIYAERRRIMDGADLRETIAGYLREIVEADINAYCPGSVAAEEWDLTGLYNSLNQIFPLYEYVQRALEANGGSVTLPGRPLLLEASAPETEGISEGLTFPANELTQFFPAVNPDDIAPTARDPHKWNRQELVTLLTDLAEQSYSDKERHFMEVLGDAQGLAEMRDFERRITLQALDRHWMEHLSNMDYLREGIGWRGYAGIDPLVLYKKEAYDMFQEMLGSIQEEVVRVMSNVQISLDTQPRLPGIQGMLAQGADEDGMGGPGAPELVGTRADRRRQAKGKSRSRR